MAKTKHDDIKEMSDKELMKEWTALGKQVESDRERLRQFSQEHQMRTRLEQLRIEPGDVALLQEAAARGIVSEEKVGDL